MIVFIRKVLVPDTNLLPTGLILHFLRLVYLFIVTVEKFLLHTIFRKVSYFICCFKFLEIENYQSKINFKVFNIQNLFYLNFFSFFHPILSIIFNF